MVPKKIKIIYVPLCRYQMKHNEWNTPLFLILKRAPSEQHRSSACCWLRCRGGWSLRGAKQNNDAGYFHLVRHVRYAKTLSGSLLHLSRFVAADKYVPGNFWGYNTFCIAQKQRKGDVITQERAAVRAITWAWCRAAPVACYDRGVPFLAKMVSEWRGSLTHQYYRRKKKRHLFCMILVVYRGHAIVRPVLYQLYFPPNNFLGEDLKLPNWGNAEKKVVQFYRSTRFRNITLPAHLFYHTQQQFRLPTVADMLLQSMSVLLPRNLNQNVCLRTFSRSKIHYSWFNSRILVHE